MCKIMRVMLPIFFFIIVSKNCFAYFKDDDSLKTGNRRFNVWMAGLVDREKEKLGGMALQIPTSLAVSQAKLESNNGMSRLSRKYNNFFGLYKSGKKRRPLRFSSPGESVKCYLSTLLNHHAYEKFRIAIRQGVDSPAILIKRISKIYAEDPDYHTKIVGIIQRERLSAFD